MGLGIGMSSSSLAKEPSRSLLGKRSQSRLEKHPSPSRLEKETGYRSNSYEKKLPNPNPHNCKIVRYQQVGKYLVVRINYPDCTNFEGDKILVFEATIKQVKSQNGIDPHFSRSRKYIHPIARFIPTNKGWDMAISLCSVLNI